MSMMEIELAERLRRMRWLAGGLLAAMLVLFVAARRYASAYPSLEIIEAFAEAAMVGGLADWFAVTALFRRPLGLPIPHTAIVYYRKDAIGRALAGFIHDHFLDRSAVARRLEGTDFASRLGAWLARPANSVSLSGDIGSAMRWLLESGASAELRAALQTSLAEALDRARPSALIGAAIDVLAHGPHAQNLVDELVRIAYTQLEANKDRLRARIRERSPWWLPRFVDNEIYDRLVQELERILGEIREHPEHEARQQLSAQLQRLKAALARGDDIDDKTRALRDAFLTHPAVAAYLADLWHELGRYATASLSDPASPLRLGLSRQLGSIGRTLREEAAARDVLNQWLRELVLYLVGSYRGALSDLISGTVAEWDPASTAARLELYLGRDLQFIRINGTVVGGLVGVCIYAVTTLMGA